MTEVKILMMMMMVMLVTVSGGEDGKSQDSCIEKASSTSVALTRANRLTACPVLTARDLSLSVRAIAALPLDMNRQFLRVRSLGEKEEAFKNYTESLVESVDRLVSADSLSLWLSLGQQERVSLATQMLVSVETSGFLLAGNLHSRHTVPVRRDNMVLEVSVFDVKSNLTFSESEANMSLTVPTPFTKGARSRVSVSLYRDLSGILSADNVTFDPGHAGSRGVNGTGAKVNSPVMAAAVDTGETKAAGGETALQSPVVFTLRHSEPVSKGHVSVCAFWAPVSSRWETRGCLRVSSSDTETTCSCSHLTHFAILMAPVLVELDERHELALSVITWVGLLLSCACLAAAVATFCLCPNLQSDRTTIHKNLCLCLLLANIVFLAGIGQTANQVLCAVVAATLHFLFLASFAWMLLEGVQLYCLLVQVFESSRSRRPWFYCLGYGIPALVVIATAASRHQGYGTPRACWLNYEHGVIWSFLAPVIVIITLNVGFLAVTLYKMVSHASLVKPVSGNTGNIRSWVLGCVSLLCLLGLTWLSGLLFVSRSTVWLAYVFALLNASQGVFIFIFHCLMQTKVRKEYARYLRRSPFLAPAAELLSPSQASSSSSSANHGSSSATTSSFLRSSSRGASSRGLLMKSNQVNFIKDSDEAEATERT